MALPFAVDQSYGNFRDYSMAVWPAQWLLGMLALVAVRAVRRGLVLRPEGRKIRFAGHIKKLRYGFLP